MLKKVLSVILTVMLVLSVIPTVVFALDDGNSEPMDFYKEYHYTKEGAASAYYTNSSGDEVEINDEAIDFENMTIPSCFDSRNYGRVTSVKNQNPLGSCWAFAFCAAAESSLIAQGYADSSIDLSEAHLLWFRAANYVEGSDIPVQQDKLNTVNNTFDDGGNDFDAMATVARWSGFAKEEDFPYVNSTDTSAMQFSTDDMFAADYNLVSARSLTKNDMDEVKTSIMKYGAVTAQIYYTKDALNYLENGECNHYQKKQSATNHAVTIVGWDDNYSASKFKVVPTKGDGAWLVKNSWGSEQNDEGYFWLSYYDRSCGEFTEVVAKPAGDYDNNYQYDGVTCTAAIAYLGNAYGANIFTANGQEKIKGCGFFTFSSTNTEVTVSLYTNLTDENNPKSGTLRESKTVYADKEGYYTVDFNGEYEVNPGEKFAVVAKYYNYGGTAMIPYESRTTFDYTYGVDVGQSFYSENGSAWTDVATTTNRGNIPLKVFTKDAGTVSIKSARISSLPTTDYIVGDAIDLTGLKVTVTYSNGKTTVIGFEDLDVSNFDTQTAGTKTVTVTYCDFEMTFDVIVENPAEEPVIEVVPQAIEISKLPAKTEYFAGDKLDATGLEIKLINSDGSSEIVTSNFKAEADLSKAGTATVKVTYLEFTTTFTVNVKAVEVASIAISKLPAKTEYFAGEQLDTTGLELKVIYNDGTSRTITDGFMATADLSRAGTATVKVTYLTFTATYTVNVKAVEPASIAINKLPVKTTYFVGDQLDTTGLEIKVVNNDGSYEIITNGFEAEASLGRAGAATVKVTYLTFTATFTVDVKAVEIISVEISKLPTKLSYTDEDAALDTAGLELKITSNNGKTEFVTSGFTCSGYSNTTSGQKVIKVSYKGFTATFTITVTVKQLTSIEISSLPAKTSYFTGETVNFNGIAVKAVYDNGKKIDVTGNAKISAVDTASAGAKTVTVTYQGFTAKFEINVIAIVPTAIKIASAPSKTVYTVGDSALDTAGLKLEVTYNNSSIKTIDNGFTCTGFNTAAEGTKTITVEYEGLTAQFTVTVNPKPVVEEQKVLISPKSGSNTVINEKYKTVSGLDFGIKSLDNYITVPKGYTYTCTGYGSGAEIRIMKDGKVVDVYSIVIYGDVNGDGWCDKTDYNIAYDIHYGRRSTTSILPAQLMACDLTYDGYLDSKDLDIMNKANTAIKKFDKNKSLDTLKRNSYYNDYVELMPQTKALYEQQQKAKQQTQNYNSWFGWFGW